MTGAVKSPVTSEFSRLVIGETVPGDEMSRTIEASAAECRALAARFDLVCINRLTATVRLRRVEGGRMVRVRGILNAEVVQRCVVTLEPVPAVASESFTAVFTPESHAPSADEDGGAVSVDLDASDEDSPEAMVDGAIDIGELTAQHLSLALDPYPRRPGAVFGGLDDDGEEDDQESATTPGPFHALAALKRRE